MHLLADFFDWYSSTFIGIPDAFVDGREGLFILLIKDRSRVFKIEFLGLSHMPNSIPNRLEMQLGFSRSHSWCAFSRYILYKLDDD